MIQLIDRGPVRTYSPGVARAMLRRDRRDASPIGYRQFGFAGAQQRGPSATSLAGVFPGAFVYFQADIGWDPAHNTWADLSGNGRVGSLQAATAPVVSIGLGGRAGLDFQANTTGIKWAMTLPAPGTTPYYIWIACCSKSWVVNKNIFIGTTVVAPGLIQKGTTPQIAAQVTSFNLSGALAIGTFGVIEAGFTNSASDYIKCGSGVAVSGTNMGNNATEVSFALGNNAATSGALIEVLAFAIGPGATPPANARAAARGYWGNSLAI